MHLPSELDPQFLGEKAAASLPDVEPTLQDYGQGGTGTGADNGGVWCMLCDTWCNGPAQLEDHKIGKKHRNNNKPSEQTNKDAVLLAIRTTSSKQQHAGFPTCTMKNQVSDDANSSTIGHSAQGIKKLATTSSTDSTTKVVPVGCDDSGGTGSCGGDLAATLPSPPPAPQTIQQEWYHTYPRFRSRDRDWGGHSAWSGYSGQRHVAAASSYSGQAWQRNTHGYYNIDGGDWRSRTTWHEHDGDR